MSHLHYVYIRQQYSILQHNTCIETPFNMPYITKKIDNCIHVIMELHQLSHLMQVTQQYSYQQCFKVSAFFVIFPLINQIIALTSAPKTFVVYSFIICGKK